MRKPELRQVESNGLLFGVVPELAYPVVDFPLRRGDRLLLYTDGFTEPENSDREAFGDHRLEAVFRQHTSSAPPELSRALLSALQTWQAPSSDQQDDITLIVVEIFDLIDSLPGSQCGVHSDSAEEECRSRSHTVSSARSVQNKPVDIARGHTRGVTLPFTSTPCSRNNLHQPVFVYCRGETSFVPVFLTARIVERKAL